MSAAEYLPVLFVIGVAVGVGLLFTTLSVLLGPKQTSAVKQAPFESGMPSVGFGNKRYSVRFYMVALAFLIFDVEIVFFYPWAVVFRQLGWHGLGVMAVFFFILILGLAYDWKKGALEWE